eukprot:CAMPEP_0181447316 /NCGR_PEP_ID=MMETSP1110-20121109/26557_1 /TAXON_ID=174948 /ORGANISM="Symbiodinium sp., Strain CCMP421" /LENGTH=261 /DNA_ID=CAMNT_0023571421 /DNA_START=50 /DNA_END=835 /DNA_ORIENTATION=+
MAIRQQKYGYAVPGHPSADENSDGELSGIADVAVRNGFVRKVYTILSAQLVVTTLVAGVISQTATELKRSNPGVVSLMMVFSTAMTIGIMLVFMCCPNTMRESPTNYVLLALFTLAEAIMVGFVCANYTVQSVVVAFGITALVVVSLTLFACQTKYDFTGLMPYFFVATIVLCGFGFAMSMASWFGASQTGGFRTMYMVYAAFGALLFSGYIVLDTQMIVGGKHSTFRFTVDDYVMAAIAIYLDIINLFLYILSLLGDRRD